MLTLYLACLIFGGPLVAASLLGGFDSDDVDVEVGSDVDVHAEIGNGHGELAGDHPTGEHGLAEAARFLSFRSFVFFTAFFGLTGSLLTWIDSPFLLTLLFAVGMGTLAAAGIQTTLTYLKRSESGGVMSLRDIEGSKATVIVGLSRNKRGKIRIATTEQFLQLLATVAEESTKSEFAAGDVVTVVRVENDLAQVSEEGFIR